MSIGSDVAGHVRVGFRMGSFEQGVQVAGPAPCLNVSTAMKQAAAGLQAFLESSPLKPYDLSAHTGVWRALVPAWDQHRSPRDCTHLGFDALVFIARVLYTFLTQAPEWKRGVG